MFSFGISVFLNRSEIVLNLRSPTFWSWGLSKIECAGEDCTWEACAGPFRVSINHRKKI